MYGVKAQWCFVASRWRRMNGHAEAQWEWMDGFSAMRRGGMDDHTVPHSIKEMVRIDDSPSLSLWIYRTDRTHMFGSPPKDWHKSPLGNWQRRITTNKRSKSLNVRSVLNWVFLPCGPPLLQCIGDNLQQLTINITQYLSEVLNLPLWILYIYWKHLEQILLESHWLNQSRCYCAADQEEQWCVVNKRVCPRPAVFPLLYKRWPTGNSQSSLLIITDFPAAQNRVCACVSVDAMFVLVSKS